MHTTQNAYKLGGLLDTETLTLVRREWVALAAVPGRELDELVMIPMIVTLQLATVMLSNIKQAH